MGLEITRKKDGTLRSNWWYGRFEINGQTKCVSLDVEIKGRIPATLREIGDPLFERSRAQAQVKLDELIREARSHKAAERHLQDLYELKAGSALHNAPLTEMESIWDNIPTKKTRSKQWVETQHSALKAFREFVTKQHPHVATMPQVTRAMALAWLRTLDEKGLRAETYNHKLNLFQSIFNPAENTGVLRNPFAGIPRKRKMTVHREPFTEEELENIIAHCGELIRPVFITGMCTAMRRGDCCLLKWASVDLENGFITVETSKTGEMAEIPLFPRLRKEIENMPRFGEYVFPEAAKMYLENHRGISWRMKTALENAKITRNKVGRNGRLANIKGFHSLRTTWITMALTAGVPMELVRRVTGHSTVNVVLKHYFHPKREDFRAALESSLPHTLTGGTEERFDLPKEVLELGKVVRSLTHEGLVEKVEALTAAVARMTKAQKAAAVLAA
jgi:integrase